MIVFTKEDLAKRSVWFRYLHFIISGVRLMRFRKWRASGEPNPFVRPDYTSQTARHSEIRVMMEEVGGP